jgi:hypothetical protein
LANAMRIGTSEDVALATTDELEGWCLGEEAIDGGSPFYLEAIWNKSVNVQKQ